MGPPPIADQKAGGSSPSRRTKTGHFRKKVACLFQKYSNQIAVLSNLPAKPDCELYPDGSREFRHIFVTSPDRPQIGH